MCAIVPFQLQVDVPKYVRNPQISGPTLPTTERTYVWRVIYLKFISQKGVENLRVRTVRSFASFVPSATYWTFSESCKK